MSTKKNNEERPSLTADLNALASAAATVGADIAGVIADKEGAALRGIRAVEKFTAATVAAGDTGADGKGVSGREIARRIAAAATAARYVETESAHKRAEGLDVIAEDIAAHLPDDLMVKGAHPGVYVSDGAVRPFVALAAAGEKYGILWDVESARTMYRIQTTQGLGMKKFSAAADALEWERAEDTEKRQALLMRAALDVIAARTVVEKNDDTEGAEDTEGEGAENATGPAATIAELSDTEAVAYVIAALAEVARRPLAGEERDMLSAALRSTLDALDALDVGHGADRPLDTRPLAEGTGPAMVATPATVRKSRTKTAA